MNRLLLTLGLGFSILMVQGQVTFHVGGNYTLLASHTKHFNSQPVTGNTGFSSLQAAYTIKESFANGPGLSLHLSYGRALGNAIKIEAGLGYELLTYQRQLEIFFEETDNLFVDPDNPAIVGEPLFADPFGDVSPVIENSDNYGKTKLHYLMLPVMASISPMKRIRIGGTLIISSLLAVTETTNELSYSLNFNSLQDLDTNNDGIISIVEYNQGLIGSYEVREKTSHTKKGYNPLQISAGINVTYDLLRSIALGAQYTQGLTSIYSEEKIITEDVLPSRISLSLSIRLLDRG
ncbi:outer membrane beta-barrel protein [Marinoscillum sp.]|uniref:outer membrane beta-barrel protein n=1 Tax=Marinoscillum sp. TaxID=2024838 RepID=UPI003BA944DF